MKCSSLKWLWTRAKCDPMGFKYFFSKNLQKSPSGWGLCPQTPIAIGSCGLCPQTPVSDTFEYTSLLNTSSKLDFYTFQQLVFALSLYQNPGKVPSGYGFRSSILRYLCPTKNYFFENFWWRHCVWFVVWAPPIKNPGYAYAWCLAIPDLHSFLSNMFKAIAIFLSIPDWYYCFLLCYFSLQLAGQDYFGMYKRLFIVWLFVRFRIT